MNEFLAFSVNFPLFLIVTSLACAVISSVLPARTARHLAMTLNAVSCVLNLVLFLYTLQQPKVIYFLMGHYPHPWGNELRLGRIESLFSAVFSLVLFLILFGGKIPLELRVKKEKLHFYYCMTNLIQAALLALVYTNDIFTGYVFIEICTLSSCGILMIRETGRTILASLRYMIFSLVGSGLFLFGVIFLYNITGHLLMPELLTSVHQLWYSGEYKTPLLIAMCLITLGLSVKCGLFPFHLWMADTYGEAIPTSSAILSGLISKGYLFFLIKLIFDVFGTSVFYESGMHNVLYVLGAAGIIIGSVSAMQENNIFRMIAYSSAAQIGYIFMGLGLSATMGIQAALFQILSHSLTKSALFLATSHLSQSMGRKKKFHNLQGAGHFNPTAGLLFTFEAFSMIGLPLTMGFISKYLFGVAAFDSTHTKMIPTLLVLAVSTILNTLYFARTVIRLYSRNEEADYPVIHARTQKRFCLSGGLFILLNLGFGIFSQPITQMINQALKLF